MVDWQKNFGRFMRCKLKLSTNQIGDTSFPPSSWFLCHAASSLVQMWVTWRYLQQSGSGTPLSPSQERERERWGGGRESNGGGAWYMIPHLSELVTNILLSLRCYGDGGRDHPEGGKSRWGKWATIQEKYLQTGSKSTFMFVVLQYSYLLWLTHLIHFSGLKKWKKGPQDIVLKLQITGWTGAASTE